MSKLIKKLVKQKDVETILPVKTITDMETIHPVVSMEGSTNDAPTSFMNIETVFVIKRYLFFLKSMRQNLLQRSYLLKEPSLLIIILRKFF